MLVQQAMHARQWHTGQPAAQRSAGNVAAVLATFCFNLSEPKQAKQFSQQALQRFETQPHDRFMAYALHAWGLVASVSGEYALAVEKLEESIHLSQDDTFVPFTMLALGSVYR